MPPPGSLSFTSAVARAPASRVVQLRARSASARALVTPVTNQWVLKSAKGQKNLVVLSDEDDFSVTLGRQSDFEGSADIALGFKTISSKHALIERSKGKAWITDLNSTNGTWVNRQDLARVRGRKMELKPGDAVEMGGEMFRYMKVEEGAVEEQAKKAPAPTPARKGKVMGGAMGKAAKVAPGGTLTPQKPIEESR